MLLLAERGDFGNLLRLSFHCGQYFGFSVSEAMMIPSVKQMTDRAAISSHLEIRSRLRSSSVLITNRSIDLRMESTTHEE